MDSVKKIIAMTALCIVTLAAHAQNTQNDVMRSNGKIYVVVAVVVTIVAGLFAYLWNLDRKIGKMEKGKTGDR